MSATNFKLRKLSLVEYLLNIQDEELFNAIATKIEDSLKNSPNEFTQQELIERAQISNLQIKEGKVISHSDLENQSLNW
jgi:hypothetical protein